MSCTGNRQAQLANARLASNIHFSTAHRHSREIERWSEPKLEPAQLGPDDILIKIGRTGPCSLY